MQSRRCACDTHRLLMGLVNRSLFYRPGEGLGHSGLVMEVKNGRLVTIEGNTNDNGSRNGIGVFKRDARKISSINKGFIDYSASEHRVAQPPQSLAGRMRPRTCRLPPKPRGRDQDHRTPNCAEASRGRSAADGIGATQQLLGAADALFDSFRCREDRPLAAAFSLPVACRFSNGQPCSFADTTADVRGVASSSHLKARNRPAGHQ